MAFLNSFNISASGLTAQRARLDIISENIANSETIKTENGQPYKRKMVVLEAVGGNSGNLVSFKNQVNGKLDNNHTPGVRIKEIVEDNRDPRLVYDPQSPEANEDGYVEMSNVDILKEIIDSMSASRAYQANVTAFNAMKAMAGKALEIGK